MMRLDNMHNFVSRFKNRFWVFKRKLKIQKYISCLNEILLVIGIYFIFVKNVNFVTCSFSYHGENEISSNSVDTMARIYFLSTEQVLDVSIELLKDLTYVIIEKKIFFTDFVSKYSTKICNIIFFNENKETKKEKNYGNITNNDKILMKFVFCFFFSDEFYKIIGIDDKNQEQKFSSSLENKINWYLYIYEKFGNNICNVRKWLKNLESSKEIQSSNLDEKFEKNLYLYLKDTSYRSNVFNCYCIIVKFKQNFTNVTINEEWLKNVFTNEENVVFMKNFGFFPRFVHVYQKISSNYLEKIKKPIDKIDNLSLGISIFYQLKDELYRENNISYKYNSITDISFYLYRCLFELGYLNKDGRICFFFLEYDLYIDITNLKYKLLNSPTNSFIPGRIENSILDHFLIPRNITDKQTVQIFDFIEFVKFLVYWNLLYPSNITDEDDEKIVRFSKRRIIISYPKFDLISDQNKCQKISKCTSVFSEKIIYISKRKNLLNSKKEILGRKMNIEKEINNSLCYILDLEITIRRILKIIVDVVSINENPTDVVSIENDPLDKIFLVNLSKENNKMILLIENIIRKMKDNPYINIQEILESLKINESNVSNLVDLFKKDNDDLKKITEILSKDKNIITNLGIDRSGLDLNAEFWLLIINSISYIDEYLIDVFNIGTEIWPFFIKDYLNIQVEAGKSVEDRTFDLFRDKISKFKERCHIIVENIDHIQQMFLEKIKEKCDYIIEFKFDNQLLRDEKVTSILKNEEIKNILTQINKICKIFIKKGKQKFLESIFTNFYANYIQLFVLQIENKNFSRILYLNSELANVNLENFLQKNIKSEENNMDFTSIYDIDHKKAFFFLFVCNLVNQNDEYLLKKVSTIVEILEQNVIIVENQINSTHKFVAIDGESDVSIDFCNPIWPFKILEIYERILSSCMDANQQNILRNFLEKYIAMHRNLFKKAFGEQISILKGIEKLKSEMLLEKDINVKDEIKQKIGNLKIQFEIRKEKMLKFFLFRYNVTTEEIVFDLTSLDPLGLPSLIINFLIKRLYESKKYKLKITPNIKMESLCDLFHAFISDKIAEHEQKVVNRLSCDPKSQKRKI